MGLVRFVESVESSGVATSRPTGNEITSYIDPDLGSVP
jgi:hypothetical protein